MNRTTIPSVLGAAFLIASCTTPEGCPGNCADVCGGKMFESQACAAEYADGYNTGFCAGVLNSEPTDSNLRIYVAGYWDGYSAGSIARTSRMINSCRG